MTTSETVGTADSPTTAAVALQMGELVLKTGRFEPMRA